jgi:hypothetical protein
MKILQTFIIVMLLATQSGCMSLIALCNYADSRIPRKVRPEPGYYEATIQYEDHATIRKILRLEQYYDAQGSARGNHWAWRQVGKKDEDEGDEIQLEDEKLGTIRFLLPSRARFNDGGWTSRPFNNVIIGNVPYVYSHPEDGRYVYRGTGAKGLPPIALKYSVVTRYYTDPPPETNR